MIFIFLQNPKTQLLKYEMNKVPTETKVKFDKMIAMIINTDQKHLLSR